MIIGQFSVRSRFNNGGFSFRCLYFLESIQHLYNFVQLIVLNPCKGNLQFFYLLFGFNIGFVIFGCLIPVTLCLPIMSAIFRGARLELTDFNARSTSIPQCR